MKRSVTAGGVVLNEGGEVIVVSQRGNSWSLPKGHVDPGESLRQAAEREIREESGVTDLAYVRNLGSYTRCKIGKGGVGEDCSEQKEIHFFLYTTIQTELAPEDVENPEARWVPLADVAELLTHPKDREFFMSIMPNLI